MMMLEEEEEETLRRFAPLHCVGGVGVGIHQE